MSVSIVFVILEHDVRVGGDSQPHFLLVVDFDFSGAGCVAILLGSGDYLVFMEEVVEHCVVGEASVILVEMDRVDVALEAVPSPPMCVFDPHFIGPCDFEWQFFALAVVFDLCAPITTP